MYENDESQEVSSISLKYYEYTLEKKVLSRFIDLIIFTRTTIVFNVHNTPILLTSVLSHSKKLKSSAEILSLENRNACERVDGLQKELALLAKENEDLLIQLKETDRELDQKPDVQV